MQWKLIKGFEKQYAVSDTGLVKNIIRGTTLTPRKHNAGYLCYCLSVKGVHTDILAHQLVAQHFIPNPENKRTVNHKDCDKYNNNVSNLEWMTHGENLKYGFDCGRKNPNAFELGINKFTIEDVQYIRQYYIKGDKEFGACPLARKFNVSSQAITKCVERKTYKSVL